MIDCESLLKFDAYFEAVFGFLLYIRPDICVETILLKSDGVHWHMVRVAAAVMIGRAFTYWRWSSSTSKKPRPTACIGQIISWLLSTLFIVFGYHLTNVRYTGCLILSVIWSGIIFVNGRIYFGGKATKLSAGGPFKPDSEQTLNCLLKLDSIAAFLIGAAWICSPDLILKNQVKFELDGSHYMIARIFGGLLFTTFIFSKDIVNFDRGSDRQAWGYGRAIICIGILLAQIYSQAAYGDWWASEHWVGISLFSIWTTLVLTFVFLKPSRD